MDKKEALKKIKAGNLSLEEVDDKLKADREVVLATIKQQGALYLEDADDKLKGDKEVVLAAVKQDSSAIKYSADNIKKILVFHT